MSTEPFAPSDIVDLVVNFLTASHGGRDVSHLHGGELSALARSQAKLKDEIPDLHLSSFRALRTGPGQVRVRYHLTGHVHGAPVEHKFSAVFHAAGGRLTRVRPFTIPSALKKPWSVENFGGGEALQAA